MVKKALYTLIMASCLFGLTFCGKTREPDYIDFQHLRLKKARLDQAVITFDLRYFNPNNFRVQLSKVDVDIYFNDKYLGHSVLDSLITIPRRDTFSIPVSMEVQFKNVVTNAVQLLLNPEVMVKLKGNARIGRAGVFINMPIDYEGKKRIDLLGRDSVETR